METTTSSLDQYTHYFADPVGFARDVLKFTPDEAQKKVLDPTVRQGILCCTRGFGKTEITAVLACHHVLTRWDAVVLIVSETGEKAGELVLRVLKHLDAAGVEVKPDEVRAGGYVLPNGSRILPVPSREGRVRGFAATLILVDEAALVPDEVWVALAGTRASTYAECTVWLMSTPGARSGFFYEIWTGSDSTWRRIHVPATECSRIDPKFLEQMRRTMSHDDFEREFMARYARSDGDLFEPVELKACIQESFHRLRIGEMVPVPLRPWGEGVTIETGQFVHRNGFFVCVDLGQTRDRTVIAILEYTLLPTGKQDAMTRIHLVDARLRLRWLEQLPLDTPYPDVAQVIAGVLDYGELQERATLVLDATGVGRPVLDYLRSMKLKVPIQGVQITVAGKSSTNGGVMNVPKGEMIHRLQTLVRRKRFEIAHDCPLLEVFLKEMLAFRRLRSGSGRWLYSGKASGTDDMVMAVAMGVTVACERHRLDRLKPPGEE